MTRASSTCTYLHPAWRRSAAAAVRHLPFASGSASRRLLLPSTSVLPCWCAQLEVQSGTGATHVLHPPQSRRGGPPPWATLGSQLVFGSHMSASPNAPSTVNRELGASSDAAMDSSSLSLEATLVTLSLEATPVSSPQSRVQSAAELIEPLPPSSPHRLRFPSTRPLRPRLPLLPLIELGGRSPPPY